MSDLIDKKFHCFDANAAPIDDFTWDDAGAHNSIFLEHKRYALRSIVKHLGYLPNSAFYNRHELFIRVEFDKFSKGQITEAEFNAEARKHVKQIRNDDMFKGGWVGKVDFTIEDGKNYATLFPAYRKFARDRLVQHLGYPAEIAHSFHSEVLLRAHVIRDKLHTASPTSAVDYKAMTIADYRKYYFTHGHAAADNSEPPGFLKNFEILS